MLFAINIPNEIQNSAVNSKHNQ